MPRRLFMASLIPGLTSPGNASSSEEKGNRKTGGESGVRRWAHRLLQRGQSATSSSMPATPMGNGNVPTNAPSSSKEERPKAFGLTTAPPPLPPKTPRSKPVPPPRTSSCLSGNVTSSRSPANTSAVHQDFIRYGNRSSVTTALMMAQQAAAAAEALTYGTSSTPAAVKSVRFGQQQQTALQNAAQQKTEEAERAGPATGETKDALAEATIGLEIAANLALAFARDVRRERMAAESGPVQQAPSRPPVRMPAASRPQQQQQQQTTVRTTGHQEVTLSEFYQLLQFVGQARGVGAGNPQSSSSAIVSSDPPAASALSNAGSTTATTTTPGKAATATETGVRSMASTPLPPSSSSQHPLPPGYLTARSFRQSTTTTTTTTANNNNGAAKRPGTADSSAERCAAPLPTQRRSHSVEVNYDNYLMSNTQRPATAAAPAPISSSSNHTLKTRSLPRTQPVETGAAAAAAPPPARSTPIPTPVRHWAEILALITQVLSGADQYSNAAAAAASCPTRQQTGEMAGKRRRPGGDSLSDSEEAYLRRRQTESSTASPTTRDRHYDSLRTPRPSSRASVNENAGGGGGHQSYLASLSQRLQIEQYIVKTLTHLTKSTTADKSSDASSSDAGSNSYIECWGSPERSRTPSIGSNVGLERALLRLDQRRTERQPRIYQHHHWRITPAECNALFLCKV